MEHVSAEPRPTSVHRGAAGALSGIPRSSKVLVFLKNRLLKHLFRRILLLQFGVSWVRGGG